MGAEQSTPTVSPATSSTATPPASCPMNANSTSPLNPLNNIPILPQTAAPDQKIILPIHRTLSSIPRATALDSPTGEGEIAPSSCPVKHNAPGSSDPISAATSTSTPSAPAATKSTAWEYPSPQQFYNALVRKGWETPEESVEMMVNIHNWLNEAAWVQVRDWEEKHDGGDRSTLASFQGRPQDISPKARYHMLLGKILPSKNGYIPPFDRHDWVVQRPTSQTSTAFTTHRYVIDYYALPDDAQGNPVFSLDVRPALDDLTAVGLRLNHWAKMKREGLFGFGGKGVAEEGKGLGVKVQEER